MPEERLFTASQWREVRDEYKKHNPEPGDYWWEDHWCPVLVVLDTAASFVVICDEKEQVGDNKWTWDLNKPSVISKDAFIKRLEWAHIGESHTWAARAYKKGERHVKNS